MPKGLWNGSLLQQFLWIYALLKWRVLLWHISLVVEFLTFFFPPLKIFQMLAFLKACLCHLLFSVFVFNQAYPQ